MIKILIADDHELIRNGIKSTLKAKRDFKIAGEASNGNEAMQLLLKHKPDVLLLDISMPGLSGIEVAQEIKVQGIDVKILFLTMYDGYEYINKCLEVGASGYLVKTDAGDELVQAITTIAEGGNYYSGMVHKAVMDNHASSIGKKKMAQKINEIGLTKREKEVVKLVAEGMTSIAIAKKLFVSPRTIDTHRSNLMKKLEVKNSAELVNKIIELDLLNS